MNKVTFRGSGQLNGARNINKVLELDDQIARDLIGRNREKVISAILAIHYPGVEINPKKISINVETIYEKADHNNVKQFLNKSKPSFSFSSIILWIIFFPFKLAWWIFKGIWKDDHLSGGGWHWK